MAQKREVSVAVLLEPVQERVAEKVSEGLANFDGNSIASQIGFLVMSSAASFTLHC